MPMEPSQVKDMLQAGIASSEVTVQDLTGTMDHYRVTVISESFAGKSLVQRHQMVNEVLKEPLKGPIHALTIVARTPQEQASQAAPQGPKGITL